MRDAYANRTINLGLKSESLGIPYTREPLWSSGGGHPVADFRGRRRDVLHPVTSTQDCPEIGCVMELTRCRVRCMTQLTVEPNLVADDSRGLALRPRPSARIAGAIIRGLEPGDRDTLRAMFDRLSPDSKYRRFLSPAASFDVAMRNVLDLDYVQRDAIVARLDGDIIGLAECHAFRRSPADVEVAVTVDDAFQRRGLGRELLDLVIERAFHNGAAHVHASVLAENRPMLELLYRIAPHAQKELDRGVVDFVFPLQASA